MPGAGDRSGASTPGSIPLPLEPLSVRYKRHFGWVLRKPSGDEKGEHLEGRNRGLGRLGGTSAVSRARAPLGAGVSRAGSA